MKRRNREVNIFNISLLDILCGALGAFCFLMIVLLPYWRPGGAASAREVEQQYQQAMKELQDLREKISKLPNGPDLSKQLEKLLEEFRRKQRQLEDAMRKLEEARRDLQKKADKVGELELRRPLVISMQWTTTGHDVDLYLRKRAKSRQGTEQDPVDPNKKQGIFWEGDLYTNCGRGPCFETWMVRDLPEGREIEVYYKFFEANGNTAPARVGPVALNHEGGFFVLPRATMSQEKTSVFVGVAKFGTDLKMTFEPQPEFADEFNKANASRLTGKK